MAERRAGHAVTVVVFRRRPPLSSRMAPLHRAVSGSRSVRGIVIFAAAARGGRDLGLGRAPNHRGRGGAVSARCGQHSRRRCTWSRRPPTPLRLQGVMLVQAASADPVSLGHARPLASNPSHAIERTSAGASPTVPGRRPSADLDRPVRGTSADGDRQGIGHWEPVIPDRQPASSELWCPQW
jgi:hypothetical protein